MPIAIDASSPAIVTGNSVTAVTTAAFDPPANSLLIAVSMWDTTGAVTPTVTMTNNGAALDVAWALAKKMDQSTGATDGLVHIYIGQITSGRTGMTITSTPSDTGLPFDERGGLKIYVVTGHQSSPLGATGSGESTTNNITPTVYTSTADNSWCFGGGSNKTDLGAPTSTDVETAFAIASAVEGEAVTKAAATTPSGTNETLNFDAVGAGAAAWNWAAIEILAAGGGAPPITTEPQDLAVIFGNSATFSVDAPAASSYQWTENGSNVGTNASSYTTSQTFATDQNAVFAVSVWNPNGTTQSNNAYLRLTIGSGYYVQETVSSDRYTMEDAGGFYIIEPWGGAAAANNLGPFFIGPLNGLGTGGFFFKDRLH